MQHLNATLEGQRPPPLRLIIYGEGGTGKSKVIQTISAAFRQKRAYHLLQKTAYTGIAASLIDGQTMHSLCGMSIGKKGKISSEAKKRLQQTWACKKYLIIDECSMIGKTFLAKFANKVKNGRSGMDFDSDGWEDLNVVLCGDFHQFPPVALPPKENLYIPTEDNDNVVQRQVGRQIYEAFKMVVILKEQKRVHDEVWYHFLRRLRNGNVMLEDIAMLRSLILSPSNSINFNESPWRDAFLITPRHGVRIEWNKKAIQKSCEHERQQLFICPAKDRIGERTLSTQERIHVGTSRSSKGRKVLPSEIEIAVGMKVLVTYNLETELDITNGARGTITDIILDPRESYQDNQSPVFRLQYLPKYILVKLERTKISNLSQLGDNIIPIEPMTISMKLDGVEKSATGCVQRTQYPITGAYAFTDYRSQGQTISHSLVDIGPPPRGTLSLFNLYVALSRSPGRDHIRLLRDFKEETLLKKHDASLLEEDRRLECMNQHTKDNYLAMQ